MAIYIENGDFAPLFNKEIFFAPKDYDPDKVVASGGTRYIELPSGHKMFEITSKVDDTSIAEIMKLVEGGEKRVGSELLPRVTVTEDGLVFTLGDKHILFLIPDKGVFLNDSEIKEKGVVKRNFKAGTGEQEHKPRYYYEAVIYKEDFAKVGEVSVAAQLTAGVEFATLNFYEIWATLSAMQEVDVASDAGIRTLVNPYVKFESIPGQTDI